MYESARTRDSPLAITWRLLASMPMSMLMVVLLVEALVQAARSKRSAFMTLVHAATKSRTNFSLPSSCA